MTYIYEKDDNVVRISSEKPINEYVWPILTRFTPEPFDKFGYLKLRFAKNLTGRVTQLYTILMNFGIVAKELINVEEVKIDRNKSIEMWELKLVKIGAIIISPEERQELIQELSRMIEKIK